ncbi:MAG: 4-hydroxythreonine-4-phosphate dehydrogenase PdxA [Planctomycetaceae bacterium]
MPANYLSTASNDSPQSCPVVAITIGDVAGIGPEVVVRALNSILHPPSSTEISPSHCMFLPLVIGHPRVMEEAAQLAGKSLTFVPLDAIPGEGHLQSLLQKLQSSGQVACWNPAGDAVLSAPGCQVSSTAGEAAYQYLVEAIRLTQSGVTDAIVTAPLNKESLHAAGHQEPGHTEILAAECRIEEFAMMLHLSESRIRNIRGVLSGMQDETEFDGNGLSIAHVTLHTSVKSVPQLLSQKAVLEKIQLMDQFLTRIGCSRKAIAVCALNPHGGENGLFGDEESRMIRPAVEQAAAGGTNVTGPLPVDTLIRRAVLGEFDGVVAMYHDQGHIPVKLIGFDSAVNITLGLPIIRTSPTHGTAFDRAWNPSTPADHSGMLEAIRMAVLLCDPRDNRSNGGQTGEGRPL